MAWRSETRRHVVPSHGNIPRTVGRNMKAIVTIQKDMEDHESPKYLRTNLGITSVDYLSSSSFIPGRRVLRSI
jgi:hypothetical protein